MHWTFIRACGLPTCGRPTWQQHTRRLRRTRLAAPERRTHEHTSHRDRAWVKVPWVKVEHVRRRCSACEERKCHLQVHIRCVRRGAQAETCSSWIVLQISSCSCSRILHCKSVGRAQRLLMKRIPPRASHVSSQGDVGGGTRGEGGERWRAGRKWNQGRG